MCWGPQWFRRYEVHTTPPATDEQKRQARLYYAQRANEVAVANYRVAWNGDRKGYFGQSKLGDEWSNINDKVWGTEAAARVDCKLFADAYDRRICLLSPEIVNLTPRLPPDEASPAGS